MESFIENLTGEYPQRITPHDYKIYKWDNGEKNRYEHMKNEFNNIFQYKLSAYGERFTLSLVKPGYNYDKTDLE